MGISCCRKQVCMVSVSKSGLLLLPAKPPGPYRGRITGVGRQTGVRHGPWARGWPSPCRRADALRSLSSLQSSRYCSLTTAPGEDAFDPLTACFSHGGATFWERPADRQGLLQGFMVENDTQAAQSHGAVVVLQSQAESAINFIGLGLRSAAGRGRAPASRCCRAAPGLGSRSSRWRPQAGCWPWLRARSARRFPAGCRMENRTGRPLLEPIFSSSLAAVSPPIPSQCQARKTLVQLFVGCSDAGVEDVSALQQHQLVFSH